MLPSHLLPARHGTDESNGYTYVQMGPPVTPCAHGVQSSHARDFRHLWNNHLLLVRYPGEPSLVWAALSTASTLKTVIYNARQPHVQRHGRRLGTGSTHEAFETPGRARDRGQAAAERSRAPRLPAAGRTGRHRGWRARNTGNSPGNGRNHQKACHRPPEQERWGCLPARGQTRTGHQDHRGQAGLLVWHHVVLLSWQLRLGMPEPGVMLFLVRLMQWPIWWSDVRME